MTKNNYPSACAKFSPNQVPGDAKPDGPTHRVISGRVTVAAVSTLARLPSVVRQSQLAAALGVHLVTLWRWSNDGVGPKRFKMYGIVLYRRDDVLAWIARHLPDGAYATTNSAKT